MAGNTGSGDGKVSLVVRKTGSDDREASLDRPLVSPAGGRTARPHGEEVAARGGGEHNCGIEASPHQR
jgi:hypothetical protein